jgi:hypothetical protein
MSRPLFSPPKTLGFRAIECNRNEDVGFAGLEVSRQRLNLEVNAERFWIRQRNGKNPNRNLGMATGGFDSATHGTGITPVQLCGAINHHLGGVRGA